MSIHEEHDLSDDGMELTTWTWTVTDTHTVRRIGAVLTGSVDGLDPQPGPYCFTYEATGPTTETSGHKCTSSGSISVGSGDVEIFTEEDMLVGDWVVSFEADPARATFKLDVDASQGA